MPAPLPDRDCTSCTPSSIVRRILLPWTSEIVSICRLAARWESSAIEVTWENSLAAWAARSRALFAVPVARMSRRGLS